MAEKLSVYDDVAAIRGIGSKKKQILSSMGIFTVGDLLSHFPVKYKDRRNIIPASKAADDRDTLVCGELTRMQIRPLSGGRTIVECTLRDESGVFGAAFFNMPYLRKTLRTGTEYVLFGRMRLRNGMKIWTNPEMSPLGSARDIRGIIPVYRATAGISSANLTKWITEALETTDLEKDWISSRIVSERRLCGREFAYRNIHFPESEQHYKAARYRLIYEQLLTYQLAVRVSRQRLDTASGDASVPDEDIQRFIDGLPCELTEGQKLCIAEIENDLTAVTHMNRLVQGDVGCGKTVVAEAAIYKCAVSGRQAAMMAPTEILARQHYERLRKDLEPYGIRVVLLISGMSVPERRSVIAEIASGKADVVTGTHAIIQKDVEFSDLALVITDEQHRFGVNQGKTLAH